MGKVALYCPNCRQQITITRPDSAHPYWSFIKPPKSEVEADVLEQVYECKNVNCGSKFTVYWCETRIALDRA